MIRPAYLIIYLLILVTYRLRNMLLWLCLAAVVSVGAALFLFQQLAGINAVVYYSTSVFRSVGIASDVAASALVGASNVFGMFSSDFCGQLKKISYSSLAVMSHVTGL